MRGTNGLASTARVTEGKVHSDTVADGVWSSPQPVRTQQASAPGLGGAEGVRADCGSATGRTTPRVSQWHRELPLTSEDHGGQKNSCGAYDKSHQSGSRKSKCRVAGWGQREEPCTSLEAPKLWQSCSSSVVHGQASRVTASCHLGPYGLLS